MALGRGEGGAGPQGERRKVVIAVPCGQIGKAGKKGKKGKKAYKVWIGFIVDAAFARGDADFEGERTIPDTLLEDCGGCHSFLRGGGAPRLGRMGWGCGEKLVAQKHCCRVVMDGYHPCSGVVDDGERGYS